MSATLRSTHVILTRFNCRFAGGDFPTRNLPGWLEHRFNLFEQYCLPTLKTQTSQKYDWLVYFDTNTPEFFLNRASTLFEGHPNFHIRTVELFSLETLLSDVHKLVSGRSDWVVTTRLDNDDGLHSEFVRVLNENVQPGRREAINFPRGIVFSQGRIYASRQSSNAFISVSESLENCYTALHGRHKDMDRLMPVRNIETSPMWLQVVHETNVSNKRRGWRMPRSRMPDGFNSVSALNTETTPESAAAILAENAIMAVAWKIRDVGAQMTHRLHRLIDLRK